MAPRGKKNEAETEARNTAAEPAETSAPAGELSAPPADTGNAAPVDQRDPAPAGSMVGDVVMIGAGGTPPSEPAETETDPAAEASTAAAGQVLGIIAAQAKEPPAPGADQDAKVPEMRWFPVSDPVSLDGEDYVIGDDIGLTFEQHEALRKAGVVTQSWADGAAS